MRINDLGGACYLHTPTCALSLELYQTNRFYHLFSPLTRLRLLELDVGSWDFSCESVFKTEVSSLWEEVIGCRIVVVRGNRLLAALFPSRLTGLYGNGPFMALSGLGLRSRKYCTECDERLLVGVGGVECLFRRFGGVLDVLVRLPGLRLLPATPMVSLFSHDRISSLAIFLTNTAPSISARR